MSANGAAGASIESGEIGAPLTLLRSCSCDIIKKYQGGNLVLHAYAGFGIWLRGFRSIIRLPPSFAWFLLFCLPAWGVDRTMAQFVHKAWVAKDGAPANIMAITQTTDGFLWLASTQGLYRFDGMEFERFEPLGQPLPSPSAYSLLSCPNGDLWVGYAATGISRLRNGTNRNYTAADGLPDGAVMSIAQDPQGAIWAATQGGLARFDGARWRKIGDESGFEGTPISLYVARNGTLWASTTDTIFYLPPGASAFRRNGLDAPWVMHMQQSANGTMWMAETVRSVRPMPPSPMDAEISLGSQRILFDRDGSLWITSLGDGLRRVPYPDRLTHEKFGKSSEQLDSFTTKNGLSGDHATAIYQDREGNVWVGTQAGLDRFTRGAVVPGPGASQRLVAMAMAPGTAGDVWFADLSGVLGRVRDNQWLPSKPRMFAAAFSAAPDPNAGIWWATFGRAFREVDGQFEPIEYPPAYAHNSGPVRITVDPAGALWISGSYGIFVRRGGEWNAVNVPAGFPGKTPSLAYADPAGRVWFGYKENAILIVDRSAQRVLSTRDGLRAGTVCAILASGSLAWIAGSNGLQLFDGHRVRDIRPTDGREFGNISGVMETSDGSLWLNVYSGVARIAPPAVSRLKSGGGAAEYSLFDTSDGLPGATQQFQPYPTLVQASDGTLWFGTSGGPASIDPKNLPRNALPPPVAIRSLTAERKRYTSSAGLRLPVLTRDLEIAYTALSLTIPERVRFRYKLEGSDKDWRDAGTRRQAFYTNLGPGEYRFLVTACNNDGVWNNDAASMSFRIDAAFYQTVWFEALCWAAGLTLVWLLYRFRLREAAGQIHSRLEERIAERERIARELHDTLLQSFQGLMLRLQVVDDLLPPGKAKEHLEQSLERADQAIAEGRRAVRGLRTSAIRANDLAAALRNAANEFVDGCSTTFDLVVEGGVRELPPILCEEVFRIAREALANAFLHAEARKIEAEITYGERHFRLRIRDDGKGIPADILAKGRPGHYGLSGMRERARQIGGRLEIWSGAHRGAEIELDIPGSIAYANSLRRFPWSISTGRSRAQAPTDNR